MISGKAFAAAPVAVSAESFATLVKMARDLYPHDKIADNYYAVVIEGIDAAAKDVVYTPYFTGVHGNYLRRSIELAGMDPDNLPEGDPSQMDFGEKPDLGGAKAWKDIWGSGQGIGAVKETVPAAKAVERLQREYAAAWTRLQQQVAAYSAK